MSTSFYPAGIPASFDPELTYQLALLDGEKPRIAAASIALLGLGSRARLETNDPPLITVGDDRAPVIQITQDGWKAIEACARYLVETEGTEWANRYFEEHEADQSFDETYKRALATARSRRESSASSGSLATGAC
jgi:hypothetical protein